MNRPVQAAPVMRGQILAYQLNGVNQQGCNVFECAGVALTCAAACIDTFGAACVACLGSSYAACKDCF